ncbi:hypothetical protein ACTXJU_17080 [Glutamicibacter ardleyensis]|uniref:hypothetical protein n=1 Tax=Glutamicibacter ardleyensis TaxID=225894 RepID=UPI003FD589A0
MKICFIGNSHLGPLAVASQNTRPNSEDEKRKFYISRTYGTQLLKLVGEKQVSTLDMVKIDSKSVTDSTLFTDEWDHFVVVGFGFSVISMVESWKEYQPDALPFDLGGQLLTPELAESYNNYRVAQSQVSRLLTNLRSVTDKPITLVPAPLPAEWAATESGDRLEAFHAFQDASAEKYLLEKFQDQKARFVAQGIRIVDQPQETLSGAMWTKTSLCLGQPQTSDSKGFFERRDFYHMNKSFGKIMLDSIIDNLYEKQGN